MAKVTRKSIITSIINDENMIKAIASANDTSVEELNVILYKWFNALTKGSKTTATDKNDDLIINEIVPFIVNSAEPVTAKTVNDKFVHAERTNKASSMLRRAIDLGLISRDKVRKNASFVYASPTYDWDAYVEAYDNKVAEKAAQRIAKARANRS